MMTISSVTNPKMIHLAQFEKHGNVKHSYILFPFLHFEKLFAYIPCFLLQKSIV